MLNFRNVCSRNERPEKCLVSHYFCFVSQKASFGFGLGLDLFSFALHVSLQIHNKLWMLLCVVF